jgi:hypothetical protein
MSVQDVGDVSSRYRWNSHPGSQEHQWFLFCKTSKKNEKTDVKFDTKILIILFVYFDG